MEGEQLRPTVASEIAWPVRLVELKDLKTQSGEPVWVLCERRDTLFVAKQFGMPGARPDPPEGTPKPDRNANAQALLDQSPGLVHAATVFLGNAGGEVRPAFHCDVAHAVPGSFPWDLVSLRDKLKVVTTILELSGLGGAAEGEFPGEGRAGVGHGVGAVAVLEGDGGQPAEGTARP